MMLQASGLLLAKMRWLRKIAWFVDWLVEHAASDDSVPGSRTCSLLVDVS